MNSSHSIPTKRYQQASDMETFAETIALTPEVTWPPIPKLSRSTPAA